MVKKISIVEFNLSQFSAYADLIKAFHIIRDVSLSGNIPLVIFDEFDSEFEGKALGWLKYFLAPMQDGKFKDGELMHPTGRGIFIFAGGTCSSLEQFIAPIKEKDKNENESDSCKKFKQSKGPDFVSRLKGFINIKGIEKKDDADEMFPLRRAVVLRSLLKKYPDIFDSSNTLQIDYDLLNVLLSTPHLKHGARSLQAIIEMSDLYKAKRFKKSNLASDDLLSLHIDVDQFENMNEYYFSPEVIEMIAQEIHQQWLEDAIAKGSAQETMKDWNMLSEEFKNSNRMQAMDIARKVNVMGYDIVRLEDAKNRVEKFSVDEIERMAEMEHKRWMNEKIGNGWTRGETRNDKLKIHNFLKPWHELDDDIKELDRKPIAMIPEMLKKVGLGVEKQLSIIK